MTNLWTRADHALEYLGRAERIPHRADGERELLALLPDRVERVLDLGTGDGRLMALVIAACPDATGVAVDFSPTMLTKARERFSVDPRVEVVEHDFDHPLPDLGAFDAVVSSFAIHHVSHARKRAVFGEVFGRLRPGGLFANLEHVQPASVRALERFREAVGILGEPEDPSNQLLDVESQLGFLRDAGFTEVDCYWKWLELALLAGIKPAN